MHEDVDLQSEHALDVMINEYQIIEIPSPSNVKSIMAYVQTEEFRFFKHMLISQVYDNPNLEIDWVGFWLAYYIWSLNSIPLQIRILY